jgi:hypothetical protein
MQARALALALDGVDPLSAAGQAAIAAAGLPPDVSLEDVAAAVREASRPRPFLFGFGARLLEQDHFRAFGVRNDGTGTLEFAVQIVSVDEVIAEGEHADRVVAKKPPQQLLQSGKEAKSLDGKQQSSGSGTSSVPEFFVVADTERRAGPDGGAFRRGAAKEGEPKTFYVGFRPGRPQDYQAYLIITSAVGQSPSPCFVSFLFTERVVAFLGIERVLLHGRGCTFELTLSPALNTTLGLPPTVIDFGRVFMGQSGSKVTQWCHSVDVLALDISCGCCCCDAMTAADGDEPLSRAEPGVVLLRAGRAGAGALCR